MKKVLSIFISVMLIVLSLPMVSFAAEGVTVSAVGVNVTDGVVTGLSWQEANTVTVEFDGKVDPATVNATTVTLKEATGIRADVPMIIEATATGAVIKLGKLRPLTDYTLTFDGDEFATTEITLQSEGTDMVEYWAFERGAQGLAPNSKLTEVVFPLTTGAQNISDSFYNWPSEESTKTPEIKYPLNTDLGNFTYEFDLATIAGELYVAGVNKGYASNNYCAVLTPGKLTLFGNEITTEEKERMNFRINLFRKSDGKYYANAYLKQTVDGELIWNKIVSDYDFGKIQDNSNNSKQKNLTDMDNGWYPDDYKDFCWLRLPSGEKQVHWKKVTMSSLPTTGVLDCAPDFEKGKIYLTFDQKVDNVNSTVDIISYDGESVEFTDAYSCVITLDENVSLDPAATYDIDFSGVVADSGVTGGTGASFTTPKSDKLTASVANKTNLSWKEANTVEVAFSDAIVPSSFTEANIAFTEKDGTIVDIPWKLDSVTATSATIKLGKLKPLTDYKLSITGVTSADPEVKWQDSDIILQSASSDITEKWYGERGLNGNAPSSSVSIPNVSYTTSENGTEITNGTGEESTYYNYNGYGFYYGRSSNAAVYSQNLYQEYKVRVNSGNIGTGGLRQLRNKLDHMVIATPETLNIANANVSVSKTGWLHYRVNFYKNSAGIYYGNVYLKSEDAQGNTYWNKIASDFMLTSQVSSTGLVNLGYYNPENSSEQGGWQIVNIGVGDSNQVKDVANVDIKKFVLSSMAQTEIMDCNLDLDNNKIEVMFDQKIDVASIGAVKVYPKGGTTADAVEASVVCDDGVNCTITFEEVLESGTEYTVDMSGIKADCGVLGGESFDFTTDMADIDVTAMSIGDGLLTSSVTVKKNVPGSKKITIILALYDGGNSMVKASYLTKTVTTNDEIIYNDVAITDAEVKAGYKAKLMVWEGDIGDVTPICEAIEK